MVLTFLPYVQKNKQPILIVNQPNNDPVTVTYQLEDTARVPPQLYPPVERRIANASNYPMKLNDAAPNMNYTVHISYEDGGSTITQDVVIDYSDKVDNIVIPSVIDISEAYWSGTSMEIPYSAQIFDNRIFVYADIKVTGSFGTDTESFALPTTPGRHSGTLTFDQSNITLWLNAMGDVPSATMEVITRMKKMDGTVVTQTNMTGTITATHTEPKVTDFNWTLASGEAEPLLNHSVPIASSATFTLATGRQVSSYTFTTEYMHRPSPTMPITALGHFKHSGPNEVTVSVTDSAGLTGSFTKTINVQPWDKPQVLTLTTTRNVGDPTKLDVYVEGRYWPVMHNGSNINSIQRLRLYYGDISTPTTNYVDLTIGNIQYTNDIFTITETVSINLSTTDTYGVELRPSDVYGIGTSNVNKIPPVTGLVFFREQGIGIGAEPTVSCNKGLEITDASGNFCRLPADLMSTSTTVTFTIGTETENVTVYKRGGMVGFSIYTGTDTGTPFASLTGNDLIATLPAGYRPAYNLREAIGAKDGQAWATSSYMTCFLRITTSGDVYLQGNASQLQGMKYVTGDAAFIV